MTASSRYWQIYRIGLTRNRGYECKEIVPARDYWQETVKCDTSSQPTYNIFLDLFKENSALAGLCLRCYVSYPILKACQKLAAMFNSNHNFSYRDLLPLVLNDDGERHIVLDKDNKTQLIVGDRGETKIANYKLFSVDVLASYQANASSMSLDNWAFLQTKQHQELKKFLAEFGFQHLSDWAMLNRTGAKQLSMLTSGDRQLVEAFHAVYRHDRRQQQAKSLGKCPDPTEQQLTRIRQQLGLSDSLSTDAKILAALKSVVQQLRQFDIWSYREPLEVYEPDTGNYAPRSDLPTENSDEAIATEERELLNFLRDLLDAALVMAIAQSVATRVAKLQNSTRYRPFAAKFVTGLRLYYSEGMSLKEIVPLLELGNWDRARRILNPGELLNSVRTQTIQILLRDILQKTKELGLAATTANPDYLENLSRHIEAYADEAVFQAAAAEIKAGKSRGLKSLYAEQVRIYCQKSIKSTRP